jgi:uncharacterized protein YjbJ (UPF0337 family)
MTNGTGTGGEPTGSGVSERLTHALEDLRKAADTASGDVRSRIDSAMDQIREASSSAQSRAQSTAGELRGQFDNVRGWVQSATGDLLDDLQKEIDKRRQQLTGGGAPPAESGAAESGAAESGGDETT